MMTPPDGLRTALWSLLLTFQIVIQLAVLINVLRLGLIAVLLHCDHESVTVTIL